MLQRYSIVVFYMPNALFGEGRNDYLGHKARREEIGHEGTKARRGN
jgi:hypothetical protein